MENLFNPQQFVKMSLVGQDGNAFYLMGLFKLTARRQGWKLADIDAVIEKCKQGSYDELLCTLMAHIEDPEEDDFE